MSDVEKNSIVSSNEQEASGGGVDKDAEEASYAPSTVLIMLGSMHFEHSGNADVLSLKISTPEDRVGILENASKRVASESLEALHIVLKSSSISSLFDEILLSTFYDALIPSLGEVVVHVLPESSIMAEDMAVQANDVDSVRMGLIMAGYRLETEQQQDGSWILEAKKPGLPPVDEDEEQEERDTEAKKDAEDEIS